MADASNDGRSPASPEPGRDLDDGAAEGSAFAGASGRGPLNGIALAAGGAGAAPPAGAGGGGEDIAALVCWVGPTSVGSPSIQMDRPSSANVTRK